MGDILKFLGRGSCFNVKEGNTSAFVVDDSKTMHLFDCGESVFERIVAFDVILSHNVRKLNVYITHLHSDHVGSLPSLLYYCKYIVNVPVTIYHTLDILKYLDVSCRGMNTEMVDVECLDRIKSKVSIFKQDHGDYGQSVGYILTIGSGGNAYTIIYTGDSTGNSIEKLNQILKDRIGKNNNTNIHVYHEVSAMDLGSKTHCHISKLEGHVPPYLRRYYTLMHIDSNEVIRKCKEIGFNVAECYFVNKDQQYDIDTLLEVQYSINRMINNYRSYNRTLGRNKSKENLIDKDNAFQLEPVGQADVGNNPLFNLEPTEGPDNSGEDLFSLD